MNKIIRDKLRGKSEATKYHKQNAQNILKISKKHNLSIKTVIKFIDNYLRDKRYENYIK